MVPFGERERERKRGEEGGREAAIKFTSSSSSSSSSADIEPVVARRRGRGWPLWVVARGRSTRGVEGRRNGSEGEREAISSKWTTRATVAGKDATGCPMGGIMYRVIVTENTAAE